MRDFWIQEQVRDEDFSIKKEKSLLHYCNVVQIARLVFYGHGSHTPLQADDGSGAKFADPVRAHCRPDLCTQRPRYVHRNPR